MRLRRHSSWQRPMLDSSHRTGVLRHPLARFLRCLLAGAVLVSISGLAGCKLPSSGPSPGPNTPQPTVRPFTVMSTDPIRVVDPAAMTDSESAMLALNVFQRLMTADPGDNALKPDAARDCLFTSSTTYTCTLNKKMFFSNGHQLTARDVKFSIERATRLDVPGSSASLLSSLRRIETPDPLTVRFILSRTDTQFGWALASPAASIVDASVYDADEVRPATAPIIGSGPFSVTSFNGTDLQLSRNLTYVGRNPARVNALVYRTAPDSATIEEAMSKGAVDVVWRGLNVAAITRFSQQVMHDPEQLTADGYTMRVLTGLRVHQLEWRPSSPLRKNKPLRQAIAVALQEDRTLDSIVPGGVPGHNSSFPVGGRAKPRVTWTNRIQMTLGYDPTMPDGRDIATQLRTRMEDTGGLSVRLQPGDVRADLTLVDRKAWTATALAWLQPYLDAPLPASLAAVRKAEADFRSTTNETEATLLLATLQAQAAVDSVVLPVSQGDEYLFARNGVDVNDTSFGPGWQLGLFGMKGG
jgi:peptide/nickel transport system substrate-binding protein